MTDFWETLAKLVTTSKISIDRPKGSQHPHYTDFIYPLDYGYLSDTSAMDGGGIDVWRGSKSEETLDAIVATVDLIKRDSEIKVLIACTADEQQTVLAIHNATSSQKGILITNPHASA